MNLHKCYPTYRNKDGFITKGELKLANKDATMADVSKVRVRFLAASVRLCLPICRLYKIMISTKTAS